MCSAAPIRKSSGPRLILAAGAPRRRTYLRSERGGGEWRFEERLPERWQISYGDLRFHVRPTGFKHTGLFPEQAANWDLDAAG